MKGAYMLHMLLKDKCEITIGKLGRFSFPNGYYIYVGSAMNNLYARVCRHLRRSKRLRWHIDYFLTRVTLLSVFIVESEKKIECLIARKLLDHGKVVVNKFGSSDCNCPSHLIYFPYDPATKIKKLIPKSRIVYSDARKHTKVKR